MMANVDDIFRFKQFGIEQDQCTMKVNTDGVMLGAWSDVTDKRRALDIGTGTGLIALMLAQRASGMTVDAIEIDHQAALQAQSNFASSPFALRLSVFPEALQDYSNGRHELYDLIVSNPPFFSGGTFSTNENKANVRHTVKLSHADLLSAVKSLLNPISGHFDLILPYIEGLRFIDLAEKYNYHCVSLVEVQSRTNSKIERLLIRLSLDKTVPRVDGLLIIHAEATGIKYSPDYTALTKDFYLFM